MNATMTRLFPALLVLAACASAEEKLSHADQELFSKASECAGLERALHAQGGPDDEAADRDSKAGWCRHELRRARRKYLEKCTALFDPLTCEQQAAQIIRRARQ